MVPYTAPSVTMAINPATGLRPLIGRPRRRRSARPPSRCWRLSRLQHHRRRSSPHQLNFSGRRSPLPKIRGMSETGLKLAQDKMAAAGIHQPAIDVFSYYYRQLEEGVSGFISEDSIEPLLDPPMLSDLAVSEQNAAAALGKTVIIKLNGGLGTSMGMDKAKSLLPVRKGQTFLNIIVDQVRHARTAYGIQAAAAVHEQLSHSSGHTSRAGFVR